MVWEFLLDSFVNIGKPEMLLMLPLGTFIGLVFGALPGLSSVTGMALVLPFTYGMNPMAAMLIYAGIISVAPLGGSLPAILLNTPGTAANAATCFDGFPLSQKGQPTRAIAISSTSCLLGTTFGVIVLIALLHIIIPLILAFRAPEIFWVIIFGLSVISIVVKGGVLKGLSAGGLGILFSLVGFNDLFSIPLFAGDSTYLWDGIPLIPFYIGLFALSELIAYTARGGTISFLKDIHSGGDKWRQIKIGTYDVLKRPLLLLRSCVIGTTVGIVPGVGGSVAAFISYAYAKRFSKTPESFGNGNVEGIIAAEVANDAKEGGSLLPTVAFGVPGSADMAVLLGALVLHGLEPGPLLIRDHLDVVLTLSLGLTFSQVIGSVLVIFISNQLARLVTIRTRLLAPIIVILCLGGAFSIRLNVYDIFLAVASGFFGYLLKRYGFPIIPIAIGYILGNLAQKSFHQALMMSYGNYRVFFSSPICIILIILISILYLSPIFGPGLRKFVKRKGVNDA